MKGRTLKIAGVEVDPRRLDELRLAQVVLVHNQLAREQSQRTVKRFKNLAEGIRRTKELLTQKLRVAARARRRPRSSPIPRTSKIEVIAEANPKKPGSKAHKRFQFYRPGTTVGELVASGRVTNEDIRYDAAKGHIRLS